MTVEIIDIGSSETSGDGESIRSAFNKINNNFASFRNGYSGSQGPIGYDGSQGDTGYTGSASTEVGYTGSQGDGGLQGITGFTGSQGTTGYAGSRGSTGFTGSHGDIGFTGSLGPQGYDGDQGPPGDIGYTGSQGSVGFTGSQGTTGFTGSHGVTGYAGSKGDIGLTGNSGSQGVTGYTGSKGDIGSVGYDGSHGYTGSKGDTGSVGYTGSAGNTGNKGDVGYTGSHGFTGSKGDVGYSGSTGYTGSKGDIGSHGYTGSQGAGYTGSAGSTGFTGSTGPAATVGTLNYVQNSQATSTSMSASPSLPFTVISAPAITTNGKPVQIIVTGDANPLANSAWCMMRLFRGSTAIGQVVQAESTTANVNVPYCIQFVDAVAAGTYTYSMKVTGNSGAFNFGEATGPVITVTELQNVIGATGYTGSSGTNGYTGSKGSDGVIGYNGSTGYTGSKGDTGYVGSQGPSGQGLINQTIILNNVAPSTTYTGIAVTEWSASYTGTGGQLLIKADVVAWTGATGTKNWYLRKNGTTVATGSFFFNSANVHTTMPTLQYIDTTGSTSAATWSILLGTGTIVDTNDRCTITVTEYTGSSSITTTGNLSGNTLISTNAVGNEGGEVDLAKSPNSTLSGSIVVIDQYADRIRFFEAGGTTRGVYIDLAQGAGAGVGTLLNNRVAAFANAGTFVTMDNIKATVTTGGQRGLSLATVSGTITCYISGTYGMNGASGGTSGGVALTTTASTSIFGWSFFSEGDTATYIVNYGYTKSYRITVQIGGSYNNNMICIERLI